MEKKRRKQLTRLSTLYKSLSHYPLLEAREYHHPSTVSPGVKTFQATPSRAESVLCHAIEAAWDRGDTDTLQLQLKSSEVVHF